MYRPAVLCVALTFASTPALWAQADPGTVPPAVAEILKSTPEQFLQRHDKNGDGYLSKDEVPPFLAQRFEKIDLNGDGKLDREELGQVFQFVRTRFGGAAAGQPGDAVVEKIIAKVMLMDANKDGKISRDEASGKVAENFDRIDTNGDGFLDRDEVRRLAQLVARMQGGEKTPAGSEVEKVVSKIMLMDTNKDGKISRDEASGKLAENFDRLDSNKDGFLDRAEVRKVAEDLVRPQKGAGPGAPEAALPDFDAFDKNADGRLTREELQGTPYAAQFDQMDANGDGRIDRREFEGFLRKKQK